MANEEQLSILRQGVEVWNKWRVENPNVEVDLSEVTLIKDNGVDDLIRAQNINGSFLHSGNLNEANLNHANLSGSDFSEADLDRAEFVGANLNSINLVSVNLSGANFQEAKLVKAKLDGANLTNANLEGANLAEARLERANLKAADLSKANLSGAQISSANLQDTIIKEADLSGAWLIEANLSGARFDGANLSKANLEAAFLRTASFSSAILREARLTIADLVMANLTGADLTRAVLNGANLRGADLSEANITDAELTAVSFMQTKVHRAKISRSFIYGINVWDLIGEFEEQRDLIITPPEMPTITVDNIEVAQFIYLLINNQKVRKVIDTVTSRAVLILGRFNDERKQVLDALKDALRERGYVPILFDFEPSQQRDLTETIQLLANMAKFVIADITDAKSIPQELSHIIPFLPSVPVQPILLISEEKEYAMFEHWRSFSTVLPEYLYRDKQDLLDNLESKILQPIDAWRKDQDEISVLKERIKELEAKKS